MRPSWTDYFMSIAYLVSTRATCDRKKVGSLIVNASHRIIATGYNGAPSGMPECDAVGHELKEIDGRLSCVRTLHAESNALDFAGNLSRDCVLFTTVVPCYDCAKRIVNAGITTVYYAEYYKSRNTELVEDYIKKSPRCELVQWEGEFIIPTHVPQDILDRTARIQENR
jgi:dCMP deaminase